MNKTLIIILCHSKKIEMGCKMNRENYLHHVHLWNLLHVVKNQWRYHVRTAEGSNAEAEAHCVTRKPKFEDLAMLMLHFWKMSIK